MFFFSQHVQTTWPFFFFLFDKTRAHFFFQLQDTDKEKLVLFKREDIRKDQIITNLILIMDNILKREGLDLEVITYRCLPTGVDDGLIEIVQNSKTLYDIERVSSFWRIHGKF